MSFTWTHFRSFYYFTQIEREVSVDQRPGDLEQFSEGLLLTARVNDACAWLKSDAKDLGVGFRAFVESNYFFRELIFNHTTTLWYMEDWQPRICFSEESKSPHGNLSNDNNFQGEHRIWAQNLMLKQVYNSACMKSQVMMSLPPNLHNCSLIVMDKCATNLVSHLKRLRYRLRLATVICSTHQQQNELIQSKQFIGDVTQSISVFTRWVSSRLVLSLAYLFRLSLIYFMLAALCRLSSSKSLFLLQTTLTSHLPAADPFVFIILA